MISTLTKLNEIVNKNGFEYFNGNTKELDIYLEKFKGLNSENSPSFCKAFYGVLLEIKEILEQEHDRGDAYTNIKNLELRFYERKTNMLLYLDSI